MKPIKALLILIFMPMILTRISDYAGVIKGGLSLLGKLGPEAAVVSKVFGFIVDKIVDKETEDPNVKILEAIDELRQDIEFRLTRIDKEIERLGKDILNVIKTEIYVHGLGNDLDSLNGQIKKVVATYESNTNSKVLTEKEKLVENAYLIGNNANWLTTGNVVFNIDKLAEVLSGNTFADIQSRNFFQIIYDANTFYSLFSGEAYDKSILYIEKVMQVYFYGSSVMLGILQNSILLTNFTEKDIEALSPLVKSHYYSCAVADPMYIENEIASIADRIFNTSSNTSLVTLYAQLKYKIKYERNYYENLGNEPKHIPIADKLTSKIIAYEEKHFITTAFCFWFSCPWEDYCEKTLWPYLGGMKWEIQNYADNAVITPRQMENFYQYFYNGNIDTANEVLSYLNDKGIDTAGELAEEVGEKGLAFFPLYNFWVDQSSCYYEEGIGTGKMRIKFYTVVIANHSEYGPRLKHGLWDLYYIDLKVDPVEGDLYVDQVPKERKVFTFNRGKDLIIPETAEEVIKAMNSTNTTINYSEAIKPTRPSPNVELENKENVRAIILGFNDFNKTGDIPHFDMYFTTLNKKFISSFMKIPIKIKHKNNLRNLENENYNLSICFITKLNKMNRANCPVLDKNIDNIEIIPNFTFIGDKNVTLSFSPLANKQKNNMKNTNNIDYSNYTLYTLENPSYVKNGKESFSVSGIISNFSNNYTDDTFTFTLNNNKEDTSSEVKCKFVKKITTNDNYTLNCDSNSNLYASLDTGISINKDKNIILLIIFKNPNGTGSQIEPDSQTGTDSPTGTDSDKSESEYRRYPKSSNGKIGAGLIVLLVVLSILAVGATIAAMLPLKKTTTIPVANKDQDKTNSSWIINQKN